MNHWTNPILDFLAAGNSWPSKLALSLGVTLLLWTIQRVLVKVVDSQDVNPQSRYNWHKMTRWAAGFLGLVLIVFIWLDQVRSIGTFLGLASAGLAIALKDFVTSLAGWLYIVIRTPFTAGDRIEIEGVRGDVIDVRLFRFSLMEIGNWVDAEQSTGRVVHIPNSKVITTTLFNYSRGFRYIWNEIPLLVTFESNWQEARQILEEILIEETRAFTEEAAGPLAKASKRYYLHFTHLTPIVYTRIADSGVLLTMRHICPPRRRRGVEDAISRKILERFATSSDIDLAYPTTRFYSHQVEGKSDLRAE